MQRALGWILGGLFGIALLGVIAIAALNKFGVAEDRYRCEGSTIGESGISEPTVMFLKLELYRPIILWADDAGSAWTEVPNGSLLYFPLVNSFGDHVTFSTSEYTQRGGFSSLTKAMYLHLEGRMFEGSCVRLPVD